MAATILVLALVAAGRDGTDADLQKVFAQWNTYCSAFKDVTFLYEGTLGPPEGQRPDPAITYTFQGLYAFRNDGATLLDVFRFKQVDRPNSRLLVSLLQSRMEMLDASPDSLPKVSDRVPGSFPGGPGSMNRPDAPERIFLPWFLRSKGDPAEYDIQSEGWEEFQGRRCLKLKIMGLPRSQAHRWQGDPPYYRLWIDTERGGYPLRRDFFSGDDLQMRTEITRLERVSLPDGREVWFPREGKTWTFGGKDENGKPITMKAPTYLETHKVLTSTLKFDQGLSDAFFSVKKHALVANDEGLRKLQRELDKKQPPRPKAPPDDPESRQKRLDAALAEADRQAQRLEASSAARAGAGWSEALSGGLGILGTLMLGGAAFWYWRSR